MSVQILQPHQNLLGPLLHCLKRHMPVLIPILPQIPRSADLRNEIQGLGLLIRPHIVQLNDVLVLHRPEQSDLGVEPPDHRAVIAETPQPDLVPGHFNPFHLIESPVNLLHRTGTEHVGVSAVSACGVDLYEGLCVLVGWVGDHARHFKMLE